MSVKITRLTAGNTRALRDLIDASTVYDLVRY